MLIICRKDDRCGISPTKLTRLPNVAFTWNTAGTDVTEEVLRLDMWLSRSASSALSAQEAGASPTKQIPVVVSQCQRCLKENTPHGNIAPTARAARRVVTAGVRCGNGCEHGKSRANPTRCSPSRGEARAAQHLATPSQPVARGLPRLQHA
ncbi:hypothetical protein E2C01_047512 [Portunus trituberculatus]|uniref:Uncharacterized protein n=1 Tax=Portunus trituberculatus TaxID=210409 RepID=A0A5B7G0T1_PORTR|nr:hypothetical protein [Portunus trituberculatus]